MENKKIRNASEKRDEASGKKIIITAADDSAQSIAETAVGIVTDGTGESIAESAIETAEEAAAEDNARMQPESAMQTAESPRQAHEKTQTAPAADPMVEGGLFKKMILYTIPIVLTGILQLLFNAADLIMVGNFCGSLSVAAVGATGALINLLVNLFIGLSVGAGVAVAHALGAKKSKTVFETVHTAIPTAILGGAVLTVVGLLFSRNFLEMMGTPADVIDLSSIYMEIYFCGMIGGLVYNFGAAILRAAGDTKSPLIYLSVAGVLNIILNYIFVKFFDLNVAGVAIATSVSQTLSAVLVVIALMKRKDDCRLYLSKMRFYKKPLLKIVKIGLPAGIQGSLFSISNVIIQSSINSFGSVAVSGNAAAGNLEGFVYLTMNSFHQTALNFVGRNYGAKKFDRIKKIMGITLCSVAVTGIICGVSMYLASPNLLKIYITDSPDAIAEGVLRLSFVCLPYFLCGLMDVMTGILRGMGSSVVPMVITVAGVCGMRIVWIYTIFQTPAFHTASCLFISYPISWILTFIAEFIAFLVIFKRARDKSTAHSKLLDTPSK